MSISQETPAYDPVKSIEGMFNGSLKRLAYFMKDRKNYGERTAVVLKETSKRYQDALDDCEIQILEAKWYLEERLRLNRLKRAPKESPAVKRKLEQTLELSPDTTKASIDENPAKRQKLEKTQLKASSNTEAAHKESDSGDEKHAERNLSDKAVAHTSQQPTTAVVDPEPPQPKDSAATDAKQDKPPDSLETDPQPPQAETSKQPPETKSPAADPPPMTIDEDFNFTSMFDEPQEDQAGDMTFGLDFDPSNFESTLDASKNANSNPNNLLAGLESYANSAGDDLMANLGGAGDGQITSSTFDLPPLEGNSFDDFLNDPTLMGGDNIGVPPDDPLNDDSMLNLDNNDFSWLDD